MLRVMVAFGVLLAAAASACGGGDPEWVEFEGTGYRAAHPPSWELLAIRAQLNASVQAERERLEEILDASAQAERERWEEALDAPEPLPRVGGDFTPEQSDLLSSDEEVDLLRAVFAADRFGVDEHLIDGEGWEIRSRRTCSSTRTLKPENADAYVRGQVRRYRDYEERAPATVDGREYVVFALSLAAQGLPAVSSLQLVVPGPSGCWVRFVAATARGEHRQLEGAFRAFLATVHGVE